MGALAARFRGCAQIPPPAHLGRAIDAQSCSPGAARRDQSIRTRHSRLLRILYRRPCSPQLQRHFDPGVNRATQTDARWHFAGAILTRTRHKSAYGIDSDHSFACVGASRPPKSSRPESGSPADRDRRWNQPRLWRFERQTYADGRQRRRRGRPCWQGRQLIQLRRQLGFERSRVLRFEPMQRACEPAGGSAPRRSAYLGRVLRRRSQRHVRHGRDDGCHVRATRRR
jgi:hypothetical protein